MSDVKRYALNFCDRLEECKEGYLVYYDDYKALEEKYLALLLQQGVVEQKTWTSVDEALPDEHQTVIVFAKYDRHPVTAYIANGEWIEEHEYLRINGDATSDHTICAVGCNDYSAVTHWMPLPKNPE
jgi:hypothetical protein